MYIHYVAPTLQTKWRMNEINKINKMEESHKVTQKKILENGRNFLRRQIGENNNTTNTVLYFIQ